MSAWTLRMAWRFLSRKNGRFFSTAFGVAVAGMAFGVASLLLSLGITHGFEKDYERAVLGGSPHLVVVSDENLSPENVNTFREKIPGLKALHPVAYREGMLISGKHLRGIVLKAVPSGYAETAGLKIVPAPARNEKRLPEIFVGAALAREAGLPSSGEVLLLFPKTLKASEVSARDITPYFLAGTFETGLYELDASLGLVAAGKSGEATALEVWLQDERRAAPAAEILREKFPYEIMTWREMNENVFQALATEKWIFSFLMAGLVVVASLNVLATLMMLLLKKRGAVALLRALGCPWARIRKIFLLDGLLIGGCGIFSGLALGGVGAWGLRRWQPIALDPEIYFLKSVPVSLTGGHVALVALSAAAICLVGVGLSLARMSRLSTIRGLEK